jgi:hypothetical protein
MPPIPPPEPAPNLTITNSPTVGAGVRTGLQVVSGQFIVEGIEVFNIYNFTEDQSKWAAAALTITLAFLQNFLERRRGQKFIGAAPEGAVRPEGGHTSTTTVLAVGLILMVMVVLFLVSDRI